MLVLGAFALRVAYNLALHPGGHPPSSFVIDEREYFGAAHMLAEGRGFTFFDTALWVRPPLYVVLLAAVVRFSGTNYLPPLLVQSLLSALTLVPLAWLAHRMAGLRAARWAALLAAIYLPFTLFAGLLLSETLFLLVFGFALVALVLCRDALSTEGAGRKALVWAGIAGLLLALAALTRATALAFVPLAALWVAWGRLRRVEGRRPALSAAAVLLVVSFLSLVPWTVRNYAAYKSLVLVDTTSGYNLWLASVGVRDEARLQADLRPLSNPVERQSFAYARAWENISADPLKFIGKGLKESLDLWRPLFSAEERQVPAYTLGRVPAWHLVALLVFDDFLYLLILLLALVGLVIAQPHPLKWLVGLWVALWVAMSFIFFAVTRFRLPVVEALIPWAGVGLALLMTREGRARLFDVPIRSRPTLLASVVALLAIALLIVPNIPLGETLQGVERWGEQEGYRNGEALLREGNAQAAIAQYKRANQQITDTRYGLAAAYLQAGQRDVAMQQLLSNEPPDRFEPFILRGEAAREAGDLQAARSFFNAREVTVAGEDALDWAWDHLKPSPVQRIDVGAGLDLGYIRGFQSPEADEHGTPFRWTTDHAEIRGLLPQSGVQVKWSGWRPGGAQDAVASTASDGSSQAPSQAQVSLSNEQAWSVGRLAGKMEQNSVLLVDTNPFIGGGSDPRLLGVRIASVGNNP